MRLTWQGPLVTAPKGGLRGHDSEALLVNDQEVGALRTSPGGRRSPAADPPVGASGHPATASPREAFWCSPREARYALRRLRGASPTKAAIEVPTPSIGFEPDETSSI
jgi:hypothetical protein